MEPKLLVSIGCTFGGAAAVTIAWIIQAWGLLLACAAYTAVEMGVVAYRIQAGPSNGDHGTAAGTRASRLDGG